MTRFLTELMSALPPRSRQDLIAVGVTPGRLRGSGWRTTSRGFFCPRSSGDDALERRTPTQRILEALPTLPDGGVLGGWAAAYVHGVDWLDGVGRDGRPEAVTVVLGCLVDHRPDAPYGYRGLLQPDEAAVRHGVPVTSLERTAFDCARWAPNVAEAVVRLDAVLHHTELTAPELRDWLPRVKGWRGVRQVRHGLTLADARVLSPWESRLRMLMVVTGCLPAPEVNVAVRDRRTGALAGFADLLDSGAGLVVEYDGAGHRDQVQHHRDNWREEGLEALGLIVVRVDSLDFRDPYRLLGRICAARARGMNRDRSLDRWFIDPQTPLTAALLQF